MWKLLTVIATFAAVQGAIVCEFLWHVEHGDAVAIAIADCMETFSNPASSLLPALLPVGLASCLGLLAGLLVLKIGNHFLACIATAVTASLTSTAVLFVCFKTLEWLNQIASNLGHS